MPIETHERKTRSGHPVLHAHFVEEVTVDEARAYHQSLVPGAKYDGWGHLVTGNIRSVSSDVKQVLASQKPDPLNPPPVALVLESAIVRMVAGLTMRVTENSNSDTFKTPELALEWLDARMTEFVRRRSAKPGAAGP